MELGKQIKKYRTEANLSQEELADKVFVSRQTISNIVPVPLVMLWKWFGIGMYFAVRISVPLLRYISLLSRFLEISADEIGQALSSSGGSPMKKW